MSPAPANDPSIASSVADLQERYTALHAAQAEVERLYTHWTELEEKRTQAVSRTQSEGCKQVQDHLLPSQSYHLYHPNRSAHVSTELRVGPTAALSSSQFR